MLLAPDGRTARRAWSWRTLRRKAGPVLRLTAHGPGHATHRDPTTEHATHHGIGLQLADALPGPPVVLVLEGLFAPRGGGRAASAMRLAYTTGLLAAPLLPCSRVLLRPRASTWRPAVLGCKPTAASDAAERLAMDALRADPPLVSGLAHLADDPHLAEAACMGRWGWLALQRGEALQGAA